VGVAFILWYSVTPAFAPETADKKIARNKTIWGTLFFILLYIIISSFLWLFGLFQFILFFFCCCCCYVFMCLFD
jgi:hypothetical protein